MTRRGFIQKLLGLIGLVPFLPAMFRAEKDDPKLRGATRIEYATCARGISGNIIDPGHFVVWIRDGEIVKQERIR